MIVYLLDIFKENNIHYSWSTIFVGRKLGFLFSGEVSKYAVEYLMSNPDCTDSSVAELAYGVAENKVDELLEKALKSIRWESVEKDGPTWNLEKRKWRYCILKKLEKSFTNLRSFFDSFEMIYADFGYPEDMADFLYDIPEDKNENQTQEYYIVITKDELRNFLNDEIIKIKNKVKNWPKSAIYYPISEDEV